MLAPHYTKPHTTHNTPKNGNLRLLRCRLFRHLCSRHKHRRFRRQRSVFRGRERRPCAASNDDDDDKDDDNDDVSTVNLDDEFFFAARDIQNRTSRIVGTAEMEDRRFRELFGARMEIVVHLWEMMEEDNLLPEKSKPKHLL